MSQDTEQSFGKLRTMFWPIHSFELKKLLPMFMMFFCISFNYTILRDVKDGLVVTGCGAEAIPFLKFWGVVPAAILFTICYAKLSNILDREKLFYVTLSPFVVFFGLFALVIYPNREALQLTSLCEYLATVLPAGFGGLIAALRNWTFSIFYMAAELWGSVVLSLLFWSFANEITRVTEAKRFYHLFGLGANFALIVSGPTIVIMSNMARNVPVGVDANQVSLNYLMSAVVAMGLGIMAIYYWINRNVLTDPKLYNPEEEKKPKKKSKPKLSIGESVAFLLKSRYLLCICILVISYGVAINLVEVTWKSQLKAQYPELNDYTGFMGWFSFFTGWATVFMILGVSRPAMSRGWGFAAMITPVVLMITGGAFFCFVLFKDSLTGLMALLNTTPLWAAVIFGAAQNIMSKSSKYSLFDPTKEMAYIPLDAESKTKGKAAIDVVGARLGKSGGSLLQQGLLVMFDSIAAITPFVAILLALIVVAWLYAVGSLNKQFVELTNEKENEASAESTQAAQTAATDSAQTAKATG